MGVEIKHFACGGDEPYGPGLEKELIGRDTVNNMLNWNHSGFSADASVRVETIADAVRIGRYMIRSPLYISERVLDRDSGDDLSWIQVF